MKKIARIILSIILTVWELGEILLLPTLFLLVGILYQLPWQYYAIFIGGYFALLLLGELAIHLIIKALNKKYASRFVAKIERIVARFSEDTENPPKKDN